MFSGYSWNDHDPANGNRMMNNCGTELSFGGAGDETLGNGTRPDQILKLIGYPGQMGVIDLGIYANYGRPISNVREIRLSRVGVNGTNPARYPGRCNIVHLMSWSTQINWSGYYGTDVNEGSVVRLSITNKKIKSEAKQGAPTPCLAIFASLVY